MPFDIRGQEVFVGDRVIFSRGGASTKHEFGYGEVVAVKKHVKVSPIANGKVNYTVSYWINPARCVCVELFKGERLK